MYEETLSYAMLCYVMCGSVLACVIFSRISTVYRKYVLGTISTFSF